MIPRTKVFVGSLPPGTKPEELRRLFENYGVVTECDVMNRCGFVHMETQEMAENAIRTLNNTTFKGSVISVEPGRMKERGVGRGGVGGGQRQVRSGDRRGGRVGGDMGRGMGGGGGGGPSGPRGGFGGQNQGGGVMRGASSGNISGPMRRDRGGSNIRNMPYNRNLGGTSGLGSSNSFDKWQGGPKMGSRGYDDSGLMGYGNGPQSGDIGGISNMGGGERFNNSGFIMGNQDRRGFALPERQMYGNASMSNQNRESQMMGRSGSGGAGGNAFRVGSQGYDGRQGGTGGRFNDRTDVFPRRTTGGANNVATNMNSDGIGGNRSFSRTTNMGGGSAVPNRSNYNQAFPPLGRPGGGVPNRNGPRREMMTNRRY